VDQPVERGEKREAVADRRSVHVGVRVPLTCREPQTERAETLLREQGLGLAQRQRLRLRVPALGEVPEALLPPPARDRDRAAAVQDLQHHAHPAAPVPAVLLASRPGRPVIELARQQGPAPVELTQDVAPERGVRLQKLLGAPLRCELRAAEPHARADDRKRLDRPDERVPPFPG
jgi:hypothetical protein